MRLFIPCIILLAILCSPLFSFAQAERPSVNFCGTSELMEASYQVNPAAKAEGEELEKFTADYIEGLVAGKTTTQKYVIPVVFHVYGDTQGGYPITDSLIKTAVQWLNEDFHGLNTDYNTVHNQFLPLRDILDVTFALAKKDPAGNPTTGIVRRPVKAGYANNDQATENKIAADAWDNYKYLNIYIMVDLYDNGDLTRSGVGTYPTKSYFDDRIARIVYNGKFLAYNYTSVPEFYSVLTHECGHFFNLIHTFENGCTAPNDNVADTPPCTQAQGCHISSSFNGPLNCNSAIINAENYMDYNYNCYKMFTKGQVARMTAALNTAPLVSLWQPSNILATGVSIKDVEQNLQVNNLHPNPTKGTFTFSINATKAEEDCSVTITDITGRAVYTQEYRLQSGEHTFTTDITGQPAGLYLLHVKSAGGQQVFKVHLQ